MVKKTKKAPKKTSKEIVDEVPVVEESERLKMLRALKVKLDAEGITRISKLEILITNEEKK